MNKRNECMNPTTMELTLTKSKKLCSYKSTEPVVTFNPGDALFSNGNFIDDSGSRTLSFGDERIKLSVVSPYSEVENGLLVMNSGDKIIGCPISCGNSRRAEIGSPTLLGEDMGVVTSLAVGLNKKWIAVGTAESKILLLRLKLEWNKNEFRILGVHHRGTLEESSAHHLTFVPNRSNKESSECLLIVLNFENNLQLWRIGDSILKCVFELSSQLGRYPLTSLAVQNHLIAVGNANGTVYFHHLISSPSDFFTRHIGTMSLGELFVNQERESNSSNSSDSEGEIVNPKSSGTRAKFSSLDVLAHGGLVDVGCEVLDMIFYGKQCFDESAESSEKPPCLIIGTSLGVVSVNVRTREAVSIISYKKIFRELEENENALNYISSKLKMTRHSSSFYKIPNVIGVVLQNTGECTTWSLSLSLSHKTNNRIQTDKVDDGLKEEPLDNESEEVSFIAKKSIIKGSIFDISEKLKKKRNIKGVFSKSVPNLGKVFDISKKKIKSSGYGTEKTKKRKMFQPIMNTVNSYRSEKNISRISLSSSSSSPSSSSLSSFPSSHSKASGDRARWNTNSTASNSSKICRNEKAILSYLSSGSRSSSSLAQKEISTLPDSISRSHKIWSGEGVLSRIKFSPRGKYLASFGSENSAQIIINHGSKDGIHLVGHTGTVNSVDFTHSRGNTVVTASVDKTVRLWDWKMRVNKITIGGYGRDSRIKIARQKIEPFGKDEVTKSSFYYMDQFLLSSAGNSLFIHSLEGIDSEFKEDVKLSHVESVSFNNTKFVLDYYAANTFYSHIVLISCSDKSLRILDLNVGKTLIQKDKAHTRPIGQIARSNGGSYFETEEIGTNEDEQNIFATYALGDGAKLWDIRSIQSPIQRFDWPGSERGGRIPSGVDLSPCLKYLASGGEDGGVYIFDLRMTSSYMDRLSSGGSTSPITGLAFNPTKTSQILATNLQGELFYFDNNK